MSEDGLTEGLREETRQVLGDLTNRNAKRAFSGLVTKAQNDDESRFSKQIRLATTSTGADDIEEGLSFVSNDTSQEVTEGEATWSVTVCKDSEEGVIGNLLSKESGSSRSCELLSRCVNLKEDVGDDILKDCSCSFCLKAAYIWSDLQYQDIKGRIATLKKSHKEASNLAHSCIGRESDVENQGNLMKSSLESNLTGHWKSLFSYMESQLANESNQLQSNFLKLKDLRENCKIDLENVNGMPSQKL